MAIILDGKIQYEILREMNRDDSFIYKILDKKQIELKDILLFIFSNKSSEKNTISSK